MTEDLDLKMLQKRVLGFVFLNGDHTDNHQSYVWKIDVQLLPLEMRLHNRRDLIFELVHKIRDGKDDPLADIEGIDPHDVYYFNPQLYVNFCIVDETRNVLS